MRGSEAGQLDAIAGAILAHLHTHPLAADSASGVARWWLGPELASVTPDQVERALNALVARRVMRCLALMDGTLLYSQAPLTRQ